MVNALYYNIKVCLVELAHILSLALYRRGSLGRRVFILVCLLSLLLLLLALIDYFEER